MFLYNLKILLRNKSLIFWSLFFPIILGTFFYMAFSNLSEAEKFEVINVGVVGDGQFLSVLEGLTDVVLVESYNLEDAKKALTEGNIAGYYVIGDTISLNVGFNGTSTTILKFIVDNYEIYSNVGMSIYETTSNIISSISSNNYFVDNSSDKVNYTVIFFYSLIGMVCMLAGSFGINAVSMNDAKLSKKGARVVVSPTSKLKTLLISLFVALLVQYVEILILFFYLIVVLGIEFGYIYHMLILSFVGCLAGISLGAFIGVIARGDDNSKNSLLTLVVMSCSFLSGMMAIQVKYLVEVSFPLLARINPVNMITDGLLSLYYIDFSRFYTNLVSLSIFTLLIIVMTYALVRRKNYDSI